MKTFQADLHIHSKLSPCGSWEMTPPRVVEHALLAELDLIAICDHNAVGNVAAFQEAAEYMALSVIPGIEITTTEEIHVVGLFPDLGAAGKVASRIQQTLPETGDQYEKQFGEQVLMDSEGAVLGHETKSLALASTLSLEEAVRLIRDFHGLAVAAHIEKPSFSVYSQLGDLPEWVPFDALEVSPVGQRFIGLREKFARYGLPMIASSDSHYLHEIGRSRTFIKAENPTFEDFAAALLGEDGRGVHYE